MKINKQIIVDNIKTIFYALIIAVIIRSLLIQPFYIPSSSMEPNLVIGDRLFVTKYSYGYSKHSFPFSPPIFNNRFFFTPPKTGDIVVFKTPADNRTDYIKRLIGLPGDIIQFIDGDLYINNNQIFRSIVSKSDVIYCSEKINVNTYVERLPNGKEHKSVYLKSFSYQNSDKFKVPEKHYFFLGDNRDCSKDSRYLNSVGYVNFVNLVGKAQMIFFSNDTKKGSILKLWNLQNTFRLNRLFKKIS